MTEKAKRAEGWSTLQDRVTYLTQTLFNVRDALQAQDRDLNDAPAGFRAALGDLTDELDAWAAKLTPGVAPEPDLTHTPKDR